MVTMMMMAALMIVRLNVLSIVLLIVLVMTMLTRHFIHERAFRLCRIDLPALFLSLQTAIQPGKQCANQKTPE